MNNLEASAVMAAAIVQAVPWVDMSRLQYIAAYLGIVCMCWCLLTWRDEIKERLKNEPQGGRL